MRTAMLLGLLPMALAASSPVLVHGHRGARAVRPENTLPAFAHALDLGVDVLELDMAVTKDDVVVVSHDPVINDRICSGPGPARPIRSLTYQQLRQWDCGARRNPDYPRQELAPGTPIPTLDEVFALAKDRKVGPGRDRPVEFNIETKISEKEPALAPGPRRFVELVLEVVRRHRLEDRVILQSFDFRTLAELRKLEPRVRLSALLVNPLASWTGVARETGARIISPERRLVTRDRVEWAHAEGLQVVPWTANEPGQWERLVDAGADAIITDDPGGLIEFLRQRGRR